MSRLARWFRVMLPTYWVFLAFMTHLPRPDVPRSLNNDKFLHVAAFGALAFLFWGCLETSRRPRRWFAAPASALVLLVYAALDESTQGLCGRSVDLGDWIANAAGIVGVLLLLEIGRRIWPLSRAGGVAKTEKINA